MRMHRKTRLKMTKQQGFTLLELLIASIIFALMAVMAYGGLANVMDASEISKSALLRLKQLQQTVSILDRDLSQIVRRPIRDEYGNEQAALSAGNNVDNLIELTRGGQSSPPALLRSSLVRVAYRFDEDKLVRLRWPQLDRSPNMEAKQSILIDNLENVSIRFLDQNNEWQQQWPPLNASSAEPIIDAEGSPVATPPAQPSAIEIILTLSDWGDIRRLYAIK
jgi:general secretion pathway protein J